MNSLRVKTEYLQDGCILAKDVLGLTKNPIVNKNTILTLDLIEVLQAFLITEVSVEDVLINGKPFIPKEIIDNEADHIIEELSFMSQYLTTVQKYKSLFLNWQAGTPVDVTSVRKIMLPLFEKAMEEPAGILGLHHYCKKEDYLYHHAVSIGLLSGYIAKKLNFEQKDILQIVLAGSLCDCGMAKLPPKIMIKKSVLDVNEFEEVKRHPIYSLNMVQSSSFLKEEAKLALLQHHERLDGEGYPLGQKREKMHEFSRILAVADVYHAMTSERVYRKKHSPFKVLEMILYEDFGKFDIAVVNALVAGITHFSIGSKVKLSNGFTAEVLFIESNAPTRPMVRVIESEEILQLEKNRKLFIEEILE